MSKIALSHSRLSTYKQCPNKFKLQFLDKAFPDDSDNPHFARGNRIHDQLDRYITWLNANQETNKPGLANEAMNAVPIIEGLFSVFDEVMGEQQVAVNRQWQKTGWFAHDVYFRAIFDVVALADRHAVIVDWKTGKVREYDEYGGQLHLNAAMLMSIYPEIQEVTVAYLFVDHKETIKVNFDRSELKELQKYFDHNHTLVNTEKQWEPRLNQYCKWCPATRDQCKFSKQL